MTVISLHGLETALGAAEPLKVGRFVGEPWAGTSPHIRVDGADVEFPRQVVVQIEDGDPVTEIDLPVLAVPWKVWVEDTARNRKTTPRYVLVPSSGPVDWGDLVDVDPTTFEPTGEVVTAWQIAIGEVAALRDETLEAKAAAEQAAESVIPTTSAAVAAAVAADGPAKDLLGATFVQAAADTMIDYDGDGNVEAVTEGGITTTYTYNADGTVATDTRLGKTRAYTYDGAGNLVSIEEAA